MQSITNKITIHYSVMNQDKRIEGNKENKPLKNYITSVKLYNKIFLILNIKLLFFKIKNSCLNILKMQMN